MTIPFIQLSDALAQLPIRSGNTDWDTKLQNYINTASAQIEMHTGRSMDYRARADLFDTAQTVESRLDLYGNGNESGIYLTARRQRFVLTSVPVDLTQPFQVVYDATRPWATPPSTEFPPPTTIDPSTIIDPSFYTVNPVTGEVWAQFGTYSHMQAVQISYTAGYPVGQDANGNPVLTSLDPRIYLAACIQVAYMFTKMHPDNLGFEGDRTKGNATRTSMVQKFISPSGITAEAADLLQWLKPLAIGRH